MIRRMSLVALAAASILALTGPADAARGGNKGGGAQKTTGSTSSITLDQQAPIAHGQTITFTVASSADRPFSEVKCYQQGAMVYASSAGHFEDYSINFGEPQHILSSAGWPSGEADCSANLMYLAKNGRWRTAASTSFHVSG